MSGQVFVMQPSTAPSLPTHHAMNGNRQVPCVQNVQLPVGDRCQQHGCVTKKHSLVQARLVVEAHEATPGKVERERLARQHKEKGVV